MGVFDEIKALTDSIGDSYKCEDAEIYLQSCASCETALLEWYSDKADPDYRLLKLLKNIVFYLKADKSKIMFRDELLIAVAKTLLRTADYDMNIREYPEKVRERNDSILQLCGELRKEEKLPVEEMSDKPYDITIYMATYNQLELTKLCLDSVFKNTGDVSYELYLIDNGSADGTYEYFKNDSRLKLIRLEENTGLLLALQIFYESGLDNGKFWLYMNNDVIVTPRWASNMLTCIKSDPKIGSVMPATNRTAAFMCILPPFGLYEVEEVQDFGERYNVSNPNLWQDWLMYYGFVLLARPSVRRRFGYHEDCFYFSFYFSDGDIILSQTKAGYRTVQARDTYIHHFDGGHTVLQNRRNSLAEGEKQFFNKYGFFSTDIEKDLPVGVAAGVSTGAAGAAVSLLPGVSVTAGAAVRILFLGSSRSHPLMQLQSIGRAIDNKNVKYYAADNMEFLKLEQYGDDVSFQQMNSMYDVATIFEGEKFDAIVYVNDIMELRNPVKFLEAVYSRLSINGKFYFQSVNTGSLLKLNYLVMSHRHSPRDEARIRKNSVSSTNELINMLHSVGFSVDSIEDNFYNEAFMTANIDIIDNYRKLYTGADMTNFERNIRVPNRNIIARKPGKVSLSDTLEHLLFNKKGAKKDA